MQRPSPESPASFGRETLAAQGREGLSPLVVPESPALGPTGPRKECGGWQVRAASALLFLFYEDEEVARERSRQPEPAGSAGLE